MIVLSGAKRGDVWRSAGSARRSLEVRKLTVVDEGGAPRIVLEVDKDGPRVVLNDGNKRERAELWVSGDGPVLSRTNTGRCVHSLQRLMTGPRCCFLLKMPRGMGGRHPASARFYATGISLSPKSWSRPATMKLPYLGDRLGTSRGLKSRVLPKPIFDSQSDSQWGALTETIWT